ncbi:MAG: uracil-DNA glycosylase [Maritimibacter sp.]|nr:uracil-DNA glycosylase [Maritimibacter sp.]
MESMDHYALRALLEWQVELGATEAIAEAPINRYEIADKPPKPVAEAAAPKAPSGPVPAQQVDTAEVARAAAASAGSLEALAEAIAAFDHCDLKRGARNTVFADGNPASRVMIVGEAPGRDEDMQGKPFVGRAGQLLDRMLDAIGMGRAHPDALKSVYITNILPWRPPQNRDPTPEEIGMMLPFVARHVQLADPDVLVLMGNISCLALLGRKGITRLRGTWTEALGKPALPMFHPAYLLRNGHAKRDAWHDLLMLQDRLRRAE